LIAEVKNVEIFISSTTTYLARKADNLTAIC
jgi:hypothetical protein